MVERRIKQAKFPAVKSLDSFDFKAMPSLNKMLVRELARCEYVDRRENVIALGNSGTGKTHDRPWVSVWRPAKRGFPWGLSRRQPWGHELMEAGDEKRLLRFQKQLAKYQLLIIDATRVRAALEDRGRTPVRGHQPTLRTWLHPGEHPTCHSTQWTEVFGSERLTGALLDRLTHHVHILANERRSATGSTRAEETENTPKHLTGIEYRGHG